jgi:hypothetical protein
MLHGSLTLLSVSKVPLFPFPCVWGSDLLIHLFGRHDSWELDKLFSTINLTIPNSNQGQLSANLSEWVTFHLITRMFHGFIFSIAYFI